MSIQQQFSKKKAEEKMLEALYEYAAACHVENILLENPVHKNENPEDVLPPELNYKIKKIIAEHKQAERFKLFKQKMFKLIPKAAVFLLILLGSFTIAVATVEGFRAFNIIFNPQKEYTIIQNQEKNNQSTISEIPENWDGYIPGYIPKGFKITNINNVDNHKVILFTNNKKQTIRFNQHLIHDFDFRVDTEDSITKTILINNKEAFVIEKEGETHIVWTDDYLFRIIGNIKENELIKMAKSLYRE
ncbi:MAG: DUF4367 domain-containing protein [Desulfitobacteriia bacterium]|jgi:hypothetical protein